MISSSEDICSPEPFMRERMRDLSVASYSTHAVLGEPYVCEIAWLLAQLVYRLVSFGLVVVLRSEKEGKPCYFLALVADS